MSESAVRARPGFISALRYPFRGARLVYVDHRELARFWIPPIVLTTAALIGVVAAALHYRTEVVELLWEVPAGEGALETFERGLYYAVEWLVALAMMAVGVIVVALLTSVIAAPWNDALSEAVERLYTGRPPSPFGLGKLLRDAKRTVGLEALKLVLYGSAMLPLFVASLVVPVVGPVLYTGGGFYFTVLFFSVDYVDWPASRHELPVRERLRLAFVYTGPMFGLGLGIWLLMFIPFVNLLFMPAAVAGATLLFLDLQISGTAPK